MKRLVLNEQDKKIAGLCSGIADYLDIDVTVVRLVFLTVTIVTGVLPGIFIYAVGAAITPKGVHNA
jgi:phage shock protein C